MPHSMKNTPAVISVSEGSLKIPRSGLTELPGLGGRRDWIRRKATVQRTSITKPNIRVAQANPTLGNSSCSINGKTMPPTEPPSEPIPVALPRFTRKKCPIAEKPGVKMSETPRPPSRPNTSMKCQYSIISSEQADSIGNLLS